MAKQTAVLHMKAQKSFSRGEGDEPERRGYDENKYEWLIRKDKDNHYDYSRKYLNFEIVRGKIMPQCSQKRPLKERIEDRLKELGFKHYKNGSDNAPNFLMDFQISGSRKTMRKLAFGDQDVCFDFTKRNTGIRRMPEIEKWAMDTYKWLCKKYGEENIIGFNVHLDEMNPHIHAQVIPVAEVKKRGRIKPGEERGTQKTVSYYGVVGRTPQERKQYEENLHTDYHLQVGFKYGLERGEFFDDLSDEEKVLRGHVNKRQLDFVNKLKSIIKERNETIARQNIVIAANEGELEKLDIDIKQAATKVKGLNTMITNLEFKLKQMEENSKEYDELSKKLNERREQLTKAKEQLENLEIKRNTINNDIETLEKTKKSMEDTNNRLISRNSDLHTQNKRLYDELATKREAIYSENANWMLRRREKNNVARINIIYRLWPEAKDAVQAIFNRASFTSSKTLSLDQGKNIWNALNSRKDEDDKITIADDLIELAREAFRETGKPEKWIEDAASDVLIVAENFASLSVVFLGSTEGQSVGSAGGTNNDLPKKKKDDLDTQFNTIMGRGRKGLKK